MSLVKNQLQLNINWIEHVQFRIEIYDAQSLSQSYRSLHSQTLYTRRCDRKCSPTARLLRLGIISYRSSYFSSAVLSTFDVIPLLFSSTFIGIALGLGQHNLFETRWIFIQLLKKKNGHSFYTQKHFSLSIEN